MILCLKWGNQAKESEYDWKNFYFNEFENNIIDTNPDDKISKAIDNLNTKAEKFDKGLFHSFFNPFETREAFGRYVNQEIIIAINRNIYHI